MLKKKEQNDKQWSTKHYTKNGGTWTHWKIWEIYGAPEG